VVSPPFFPDLKVTQQTALNFRLTNTGLPEKYTFSLDVVRDYVLSVKAKLACAGHEPMVVAVESNGQGLDTQLFSVDNDSPLGRAIHEQDGFVLSTQITTVSAAGMCVSTQLEMEKELRPPPSLAKDLQDCLTSSDFGDVTLKSHEGDVFPAHRQLLAMRSPVFKAMFYGSMSEAQSGTACIDSSSASLQHLLHCMYTDEINAKVMEVNGSELFDLGTQYQVPRLVALAKAHLFSTLSVENAVEHFSVAVRFSEDKLGEACKAIIRGNLAAVMKTDGWTQIAKDPVLMGTFLKDGGERQAEAESPRKLKRPRLAPR